MTQAEGGAALSRDQGITLWRQIARAVEGDITSGTLAIGAKLPTEAELSARFAVNRHTVRRALEELQRQGLVRVEQGRGSFVAEESIDYEVVPRTRPLLVAENINVEPDGTVIEFTISRYPTPRVQMVFEP